MIQNKRGSHVGVVISFAIFIIFLVFLFVIIEPSLSINEGKESTLDNIGALLTAYLKSDLTTASIRIKQTVNLPGNCVEFEQVDFINAAGLPGSNIFVKDSGSSGLESDWRFDPDLRVENDGVNRFFKIYSSSSISSQQSTLNGCKNIDTDDYITGIVKTEERIFERNITSAIELYKADYAAFRQSIGITSEDFSFDFTYSNGTTLSTGESSGDRNIYAKQIPVNYIDNSLNSNIGIITIKTW